ncbi:MAG: hypothetical protein ACTHN7_00190 [Solirubrobacterales bacterium]
MPPGSHPDFFAAQVALSRTLHGHKYVFPVAVWIVISGVSVVSASDAMVGLGGHADRPRVLEALERLTELGAMIELPRPSQVNAARSFQRVEDPYWPLVESHLARLEAETRAQREEGRSLGP